MLCKGRVCGRAAHTSEEDKDEAAGPHLEAACRGATACEDGGAVAVLVAIHNGQRVIQGGGLRAAQAWRAWARGQAGCVHVCGQTGTCA